MSPGRTAAVGVKPVAHRLNGDEGSSKVDAPEEKQNAPQASQRLSAGLFAPTQKALELPHQTRLCADTAEVGFVSRFERRASSKSSRLGVGVLLKIVVQFGCLGNVTQTHQIKDTRILWQSPWKQFSSLASGLMKPK